MTLSELLHELRHNILRDTSTALDVDEQEDLLWTDSALTSYINDAFTQFAHKTEYLQDASTPDVCRVPLVAGQLEYPLHPSVIRILSATHGRKTLPVTTVAHMLGNQTDHASYDAFHREDYPGVFAIVPDYEVGVLRLVGTPKPEQAGEEIALRVTRYPLEPLKLTDPDATPEFPERFHLDILEWAAWRALRNHDADGENMAKASAHKTRFTDAVEEVKQELKARRYSRMQFDGSWRWN